MTSSLWMDRFGGVASATCATHCLVMAFAPALVAVTGLGFLANEAFEWAFFSSAIGFAGAAAWLGYRSHRTPWVVAGFGLGMVVLITGRLAEALKLFEGGAILAITGGALLVASHVGSATRTRTCRKSSAT